VLYVLEVILIDIFLSIKYKIVYKINKLRLFLQNINKE